MNAQRLAQQLITDEDLRLKPYRCKAGKLTIGVGRNLDDRGITKAEALVLLDNDIKFFWAELVAKLPWVMQAPEPIQEVLVNMAFNLGIDGLLGFRKMLKALQAGDYAEAVRQMDDSDWSHQVDDGLGGKVGRVDRLAAMVRSCAKGA
ncbi:MAG: glycoside hydrolase family protein [Humidesulfovibrio sp.]